MINRSSIEKVANARFSKHFIKPLYDSFCFSKIPGSVLPLLRGEKNGGLPESCFLSGESPYDLVVLLFIDGFAWRFFERYMSHPFCRRFLDEGVISKLTAQFPSTTAAQVTTIHTGLEVGQTGIYEWFQYEPQVGRMVAPLLFSYAGDKVVEGLRSSGLSAEKFLPFSTIYQKLHQEKITSYLFHHADLSSSVYSQKMSVDTHTASYFTLEQGLKSLRELIEQNKTEKGYALFYFADIDSVGHRKGVESPELEKTILATLDLLENTLMNSLSPGKKTALLLTADHGMTRVDPKTTIYLNQEIDRFSSLIQTGPQGHLLVPAGSCRDLFLHIKETCLDEAFDLLSNLLKEKGEVWKTQELVSQGFFGSNVSCRFLERVGNLVVLPYEDHCVWWREKGKFEQNFYGAHGGLTQDEMEIPFLFLKI